MRVDCVLIDDDPLVHLTWKMKAKRLGKVIATYASPEAFFASAAELDKTIPVYIDSNLGPQIQGETVAKEIRLLGFSEIYLATGYSADHFGEMPWLTGIVSKDPPWKE